MKLHFNEVAETLGLQCLQASASKSNEDPGVLWELHCQGHLLAVCSGSQAAIFHLNLGRDTSSHLSALQICAAPHRLTALCWLSNLVPSPQNKRKEEDALTGHLMMGNEKGEFMIYDILGDLIIRQKLHISAILEIKSRPASIGLDEEEAEDISIMFQDVLCCVPLPELLAFIRLHEAGSGQCQDPTLRLAHAKFSFGKNHANRADGLQLGTQIPSLKTQLKKADSDSEETKINIVTVGRSPSIGMFSATLVGSKKGTLAMLGKFASSMTLGFSAIALKGSRRVLKGGMRALWSHSREEELVSADPATLEMSLKDNKRHIRNLIPSPRGCLAVACDNLGRVLLLDMQTSIVLRIWKGYRDAQCAWLTQPLSHSSPSPSGLYLVIYGWRRETLEVWPMRYGQRVYSHTIGPNCKLLPTMPPMGLGVARHWEVKCAVLDYEQEEIWDVGEQAFPVNGGKVEAIWDMMLTHSGDLL